MIYDWYGYYVLMIWIYLHNLMFEKFQFSVSFVKPIEVIILPPKLMYPLYLKIIADTPFSAALLNNVWLKPCTSFMFFSKCNSDRYRFDIGAFIFYASLMFSFYITGTLSARKHLRIYNLLLAPTTHLVISLKMTGYNKILKLF